MDGARVEECPVDQIYESLPGRDGPLGSPGVAAKIGPLVIHGPRWLTCANRTLGDCERGRDAR
ncbi:MULTISPECIES: hypothetical protein [Mycobacteroides]|uniref:hypothetical protein n=1 Tax=Mycobacteroides TaxID=670516 RepID=UPI0035632F52